ncbi:hypothetical protein BGZ63DRAFT_399148 [Mariannaea sp. PMI_226]|nr:hypothetical protein BGZ63DRAFT_399148 [Mariannaea sp. PMI_226]
MSSRQEKVGATDPSPTSAQSMSASGQAAPGSDDDDPLELEEDEEGPRSGSSKEALCSRTSFFVNVDWRLGATLWTATTIVGQMYTERLDPIRKSHRYPIVLIHGDFHTGQLTKPDGNPGWASYFVRRGFQVYLVDMPPCGRSNYLTGAHFHHRDLPRSSHTLPAAVIESDLTAQGKNPAHGGPSPPLKHARASLHNKWPGTGQRGDAIFANYCASTVTLHLKRHERQSTGQNALQALLKRIGKAFLVGEGSGGTMAWLATDVEPDLVAGVVAVEPSGPPFGTAFSKINSPRTYTPFIEREAGSRLYGVADIPLTYDPPTHTHRTSEHFARDPLDVESVMRPDRQGSCFLQRVAPEPEVVEIGPSGKSLSTLEPPCKVRQLINLKIVPHAIVTAHASSHSVFDWATFAFLQQAGVSVDWLQLEAFGILGNGHLMFLETNSDEIAGVVERWIQKHETVDDPGGSSVGVVNPITPKSHSIYSSESMPNESEKSGKKSRLKVPSKSFTRSHETPTRPLGTSPRARLQHQSEGRESTSQATGLNQAPEANGKRYFLHSPPGAASHIDQFSALNQDAKRPRVESSKASARREFSTPTLLPVSGSLQSSKLAQPNRNVSFQTPQMRDYSCYSPPISDLNMLRASYQGPPSQLRQQMDMIAKSDRIDRQLERNIFSAPPRIPPVIQRSYELYSHLAVDPRLDGQPRADLTREVPHTAQASLELPHRRVSGDGTTDISEHHWHRPSGYIDFQPRRSGSAFARAARIRQLDRPAVGSSNPTPIDHQGTVSGSDKPITPLFRRQSNAEAGHEGAFDELSTRTPPSPSPAPRGLKNQISQDMVPQPKSRHGTSPK